MINRYFLTMFILLGLLQGCQTVGDTETTNIVITDVVVTKDSSVLTSDRLVPNMTNVLKHYAFAYNSQQSGRLLGYRLEVNITGVHYKNALVSLLIGDANSITSTAKVIDPTNGEILRSFDSGFVDGASAILNGVSGAVLSVSVGKVAVDTTLAKGLPTRIMQQTYLHKTTPERVKINLKKTDLLSEFTGQLSPLSPAPADTIDVGVEEVLKVEQAS